MQFKQEKKVNFNQDIQTQKLSKYIVSKEEEITMTEKHLSPVELQKIIKKNKRRSKKTLFICIEKDMGIVSTFCKEPKQQRKIFISFDVVVNLDLFDEDQEFNDNLFFNDLNFWRTPTKITKLFIPGAHIPNSLIMSSLLSQNNNNCQSSSCISDSTQVSQLNVGISQYFKDSPLNNNFLIEVELDTITLGMNCFKDLATVLNSYSHKQANNLANQLIQYQHFVSDVLQSYKLSEKSMMRIYPNFIEENILEQTIIESNLNSFKLAHQIIQDKIKNNKFVSYIVKINKGGQQLLHKFGYSRAFLDVMGISGNYEQFFMRQGPINPLNKKNRLDRLIVGLEKKQNGFYKKQANNYIDSYQDEELYTIDNILFTCNFQNEKYFLNQSDQYFVKSAFLLQISSFDITEKTINRIISIRQQNGQNTCSDINFQQLQYTCESEIFVNKFYQ